MINTLFELKDYQEAENVALMGLACERLQKDSNKALVRRLCKESFMILNITKLSY